MSASALSLFDRGQQTDRWTPPTTLLGQLSAPFCLPVLQHYPYSCSLLIALDPAEKQDYMQGLGGLVFIYDEVLFSAPLLLDFAFYSILLIVFVQESLFIWPKALLPIYFPIHVLRLFTCDSPDSTRIGTNNFYRHAD